MTRPPLFQSLVLFTAIMTPVSPAMAQTPAFTYQGQLKDNGLPVNGSYNMEFKLFNVVSGPGQVGSTITRNGVPVTNGLFNQTLDFGAAAFNGDARWLEVAVNGTALPRQPITATPYATKTRGIFSNDAGNVGIGTTTPNHRLRISGGPLWTANAWTGSLELDNAAAIGWQSNAAGRRFGIGQSGGGMYFFHTSSDPGTTASPADYDMVIADSGNVGIGSTAPAFPLTIQTVDSFFVSGYGWVHTNGTVELGSYVDSSGGWLGTRSNHPLYFFTDDSSPRVTLTTAGALGIGTQTVPAGVKLAVDGKILCEEMEVQLSGDWPDYVFEKSYDLLPLSELEKAVEKEKHLPGIPSAADVAKNGVKVGQMQAQLVEKVEELTLYMIQMNKQLERVERENTELKMRLATLEGNR